MTPFPAPFPAAVVTPFPAGTKAWSGDLAPGDAPPWMIELANALRLFPHDLPTGVIVGSAVIEKVVEVAGCQWENA